LEGCLGFVVGVLYKLLHKAQACWHTLKSILKLDADLILSGHADPVDRKTVEALAAAVESKRTKVKALIDAGRSLDEIQAALSPDGKVPAPGRWPSLAEVIYREEKPE